MSDKIAVIYGGYSCERLVSLKSGKAIYDALKTVGIEAILIDLNKPDLLSDRSFLNKLIKNSIKTAVIAIHGTPGEDGILQGFLQLSGIKYSGSSVISSALSMDKQLSKLIFSSRGILTPRFMTIKSDEAFSLSNWEIYPAVVKPAAEGSSIGVATVNNFKELDSRVKELINKYTKLIIEEKIDGDELTVGFMGKTPLPIIKIVPKIGFYDYKNKYTKGNTEYIVPAPIDDNTTEAVIKTALNAITAIGASGASRVDIILKDSKPYVLEVNTIPGMTETSLLPQAAKEAGYDFKALCKWIVLDAKKR